jgi:hypothetical protein
MNALPHWLLLVISLPSTGASARMRIWRSLKALGCAALRDGAYLLPDRPSLRAQLAALAEDTVRESGSAWLLDVAPRDFDEDARYRTLFDRRHDFAGLVETLADAGAALSGMTAQDASRLLRKLRREVEALQAIDYFPGDASVQGAQAWQAFSARAEALLAGSEPRAVEATIARLDARDFQGRLWATRRRLWVDRVASAWLIRRWIDREARFLWLASPADCPPDALGFDFDGAAFTHVGGKVTFEVLLASFGLDGDAALARIAALVHALDVGTGFVAEAAGFEAMLAGLRAGAPDDDRLLANTTPLLDALYTHYSAPKDPA